MKHVPLAFLCLFTMFLGSVPSQSSQAPFPDASSPMPPAHDPQLGPQPGPTTLPGTRDQMKKMQRELNVQRQKQLKEDTAKLLQLATELKDAVDKTNEHVLSLDVVKKADEIERLAKHVKTSMRDEMR
jgi:hypothetical protein